MIFYRLKGKEKWDEDTGEGASIQPIKKMNKQGCEGSLVATADYRGGSEAHGGHSEPL